MFLSNLPLTHESSFSGKIIIQNSIYILFFQFTCLYNKFIYYLTEFGLRLTLHLVQESFLDSK